MLDIVVIGSGPAGLTAAIYARRAGKKVLIIEKESFGGQMTHSPKIENYPGLPALSGNELAEKMMEQALGFGAEIELDEIISIRNSLKSKSIVSESAEYFCKAIIIAAGSKHRTLELPREEEFVGNGISYCALCDGAFYKGKKIAVIGGGNTALQEAVLLSDVAEKVTIVQNLNELTGERTMIDIVENKPNIEILTDTIVTGLNGRNQLDSIQLENSEHGDRRDFPVDGIFVAIGQKPDNEAFRELCELDERGFIIAGEDCTTKTPGVFAAGDCRTKGIRQVATAVGDGAIAALAACRYIDRLNG